MTKANGVVGRAAALLPAAVGWGLIAVGLASTLRGLGRPIGAYDEGILLTNAWLLTQGQVPYRDFYANYPPGVFLTIAGLWKVFGTSVLVERMLGVFAHLAIAAGCGWLAGSMRGKRFSSPAAGVVLIWLAWLGTPAYAWLLALAAAVLACGLLLRASKRQTSASWVAAGAMLGAVGCFRHDLFVYLAAALLAGGALWALVARRGRPTRPEWGALARVAAGAAVPLAVIWLPTVVLAGFRPVLDDIYFTQVRVMQARVLPMPELTPLVTLPPLPFRVPAFFGRGYEGAVALTLIGPLLAVVAFGLSRALGLGQRLGPGLLLALSLAVLPQMVGRSDPYHAFLTTAPALLLLCTLLESGTRSGRVGGALAVGAAFAVLGLPVSMQLSLPAPPPPAPWQPSHARYGTLPEPVASRERVLAFLARETAPGEPIYVGLSDHSRVYVSEMDLYFLSERPGATRIMQFDPNVVNREDVQRQMVAEIEARAARIAVLSARFEDLPAEPNESAVPGSSYLDEYLAARFEVVERTGPYTLLRRRSA